jgi:hypothetical protein
MAAVRRVESAAEKCDPQDEYTILSTATEYITKVRYYKSAAGPDGHPVCPGSKKKAFFSPDGLTRKTLFAIIYYIDTVEN